MSENPFGTALNALSLGDLQKKFSTLTAPTIEAVAGRYQACLVGPWWYRLSSPAMMATVKFKGWWGKRLGADGACINLFAGGTEERFPMTLLQGTSKIDGRPTLRLTYPKDAPFPWYATTDELRALDENCLLGMTLMNKPLLRNMWSPFLLVKA